MGKAGHGTAHHVGLRRVRHEQPADRDRGQGGKRRQQGDHGATEGDSSPGIPRRAGAGISRHRWSERREITKPRHIDRRAA